MLLSSAAHEPLRCSAAPQLGNKSAGNVSIKYHEQSTSLGFPNARYFYFNYRVTALGVWWFYFFLLQFYLSNFAGIKLCKRRSPCSGLFTKNHKYVELVEIIILP